MRLSIVIPAHNEEQYIGECLDNICQNTIGDPRLLEIIVVDNASTDKTVEVASRRPGVSVIREDKKGVNYAREKGRVLARGDLVAFIDADTIISPTWLDVVYDSFTKDKEMVSLSGPTNLNNTSAIEDLAVETYWSMAVPAYRAIGYMAVGGNLIVKKEALEKIGGFNTNIAFYGDDADLARRLSKIGKVVFDKKLAVHTSDRRLRQEGVTKTLTNYIANYISVAVLKKPITKRYNDIR